MSGDGGLWALVGFLGSLLLIGTIANLVVAINIKFDLEKVKGSKLRRSRDGAEEDA